MTATVKGVWTGSGSAPSVPAGETTTSTDRSGAPAPGGCIVFSDLDVDPGWVYDISSAGNPTIVSQQEYSDANPNGALQVNNIVLQAGVPDIVTVEVNTSSTVNINYVEPGTSCTGSVGSALAARHLERDTRLGLEHEPLLHLLPAIGRPDLGCLWNEPVHFARPLPDDAADAIWAGDMAYGAPNWSGWGKNALAACTANITTAGATTSVNLPLYPLVLKFTGNPPSNPTATESGEAGGYSFSLYNTGVNSSTSLPLGEYSLSDSERHGAGERLAGAHLAVAGGRVLRDERRVDAAGDVHEQLAVGAVMTGVRLKRELEALRAGRERDESAFTLVELLVTMLILAIVMSLTTTLIIAVGQQTTNMTDTVQGIQQEGSAAGGLVQYLRGAVQILPLYNSAGTQIGPSANELDVLAEEGFKTASSTNNYGATGSYESNCTNIDALWYSTSNTVPAQFDISFDVPASGPPQQMPWSALSSADGAGPIHLLAGFVLRPADEREPGHRRPDAGGLPCPLLADRRRLHVLDLPARHHVHLHHYRHAEHPPRSRAAADCRLAGGDPRLCHQPHRSHRHPRHVPGRPPEGDGGLLDRRADDAQHPRVPAGLIHLGRHDDVLEHDNDDLYELPGVMVTR